MNKTVNINLGGMFFHIDEDAYQKLTRYFDAIKRSLSTSNGQDEIIKDIEMRIAELIGEKHLNEKQVINIKEVDEIITVMGQPEDYRIEDDNFTAEERTYIHSAKRAKKLYRDTEKGMLGGVASGLGHYFGIDAVWLRILFFIFVWAGGSGILAYVVLWIVMPEAVTTSEKLEMTGEPVTISNIEKKVREEFESVSERFKNANFDKMGKQVTSGAGRVAHNLGDVFLTVFKIFAKILGAVLLVFSSLALLGIFIASIVMLFSSTLPDNTILNNFQTPIGLETPLWAQGILLLLTVGIPFFFLIVLGLKLLVNNLRSIGNIAKYSLLAIWIIAVGIAISLGINEATQMAYEGKTVQKEIINITAADTLFVKFKTNDFYAKDLEERNEFKITQDENNRDVIYSNNVRFIIMKTDEALPFLQIEKLANGKTSSEAKKRAENIKYAYKIDGNKLILDNYLVSDAANKLRGQSVELFLYLPVGFHIKPDSSVQSYDESDDWNFFNLHHSGNYTYKVTESRVMCLDCPANENEMDDVEGGEQQNDSLSTTITVNGNGINIQSPPSPPSHPGHPNNNGSKRLKQLEMNEDGIIIKTD